MTTPATGRGIPCAGLPGRTYCKRFSIDFLGRLGPSLRPGRRDPKGRAELFSAKPSRGCIECFLIALGECFADCSAHIAAQFLRESALTQEGRAD